MSTALPEDFPGLQKEAERLAKEHVAACQRLYKPWDELPLFQQVCLYDAQATLLRDLTRQASRDWALRWLASRTIEAKAPGYECAAWYRYQSRWVLWFGDESASFSESTLYKQKYRVAGISAIMDPTEALALVCVHVANLTPTISQ